MRGCAKVRATVGITIQMSVVNASTFVDEPLGEKEKTGKILCRLFHESPSLIVDGRQPASFRQQLERMFGVRFDVSVQWCQPLSNSAPPPDELHTPKKAFGL